MRCTDCHGTVRPIVSVDIDGTLAGYHFHWFRFAKEWLGEDGDTLLRWLRYDGTADLATHMGLDKRTYRQMKLAYRQGGMKRSMPVMPGALFLMTTLLVMDVEIWLTTTRPYLQIGNVDEDTREWLRRQQLPFDHLLYTDRKYEELVTQVNADRIACVIEDQVYPEYSEAVNLGLPALLVRTPYNEGAIREAGSTGPNMPQVVDGLDAARAMTMILVNEWRKKHG